MSTVINIKSNEHNSHIKCVICLNEIDKKNIKKMKICECETYYCKKCYNDIINNERIKSCPTCRKEIDIENLYYSNLSILDKINLAAPLIYYCEHLIIIQ